MTLEEYESVREQMNKDAEAGFVDLAEEPEPAPAEPVEKAYATEGQQGYVSTDIDEEEDER